MRPRLLFNRKKEAAMKRIVPIAKGCLALLLAVSLALAAQAKRNRLLALEAYEQAKTVARLEEESRPAASQGETPSAPAPEVPDEPPEVPAEPLTTWERLAQIDLAALQEINPDVIGWIEIPGTTLSYPLVQGRDNQYYLNRTWEAKRNPAGSIFMDYTCSPELDGFHTIIYGHRMNNDTMFGVLQSYRNPDFWTDHPSVYIAIEDGVYRYDLFSAQEAEVKGVVYRLDIVKSGLEEEFFRYCLDNAVINTLLTPTAEDRILTLSTCTGRGHATRWVVHAVLAQTYPAGQPEDR